MAETPGNIVQGPSAVLSDDGSSTSRRSSSQASRTSNDSTKNSVLRKPRRQTSKTTLSRTHTRDPSLTSFPSFSQDPEDHNAVTATDPRGLLRTVSQKARDRKATLAGLTGLSSVSGLKQSALFDDTPRSSLEIPGSLHLTTDNHIERLIARTGAVKLVRQYAADLAQRDSEISVLRARADLRERELKKMLREADVPTSEVEKRLLRVERSELSTLREADDEFGLKRNSATSLDGMMNEAMSGEMSLGNFEGVQDTPARAEPLEGRKQSLAQSTLRRINSTSGEASRDSATSSRTVSRANSAASTYGQDADATLRPRNPSSNTRLPGFQSIFQPPANNSYFIGGSAKTIKKPKAVDELSVRSNHSGKSTSSWMRIFGSGPQKTRSRASSLEQSSKITPGHADAAASLGKVRTNGPSQPQKSATVSGQAKSRPIPSRSLTGGRLSSSPNHIRKDSNASNMPPTVELDSMIESSQLPPTMTDHNPEGLLTDRFGFIYDRKRKRNHLQAQQTTKQKAELRSAADSSKIGNRPTEGGGVNRPSTPVSVDDDAVKKSWQDYLTPSSNTGRGRPRELLSHTPSAGAVVTVSSADAAGTITPPRVHDTSISVSSQKALPSISSISRTESSAVTVSVGSTQEHDTDASERAATKMLLDQLTEVHDSLQAERTVKWNDFLRRVRAERAINTDRAANNAPEADLVDGELVGIATLGRSSKTKSKFLHFKSLVLAGIPVSLRPKVWAECSGATQMRIPGYYEDLVARSEEGLDIDNEISHQITADVKRTLRDNIFFRDPTGPGPQRLEELLRAYSLHNPKIGYCQGMNLITASLLLICVTPEDCFWLLVAIIDHILPSGYFDYSLLIARADQIVLRQYVTEVLPKLDAKLQDLGVELEACTFHWFLSLYSGVLTGGEALYRIWDVVLCLNSSDAMPNHQATNSQSKVAITDLSSHPNKSVTSPLVPTQPSDSTSSPSSSIRSKESHDGTSSPFLFQLSLALLKLNEPAILALDSPATVYTYLNHNMTAHNITIDALVAASEGLRGNVNRKDVLERRRAAVKSLS